MATFHELMGFDAMAIAEEAVSIITTGGTVVETATGARNGGGCLRINRTGANSAFARRLTSTAPPYPSGKTTGAMVFYLKVNTQPSTAVTIATLLELSGNDFDLKLSAAGALNGIFIGGTASGTIATLSTGIWYRVEVRWDTTTTTHRAWVSVNGGAETAITRSGTAGVQVDGWRFGTNGTAAGTYDLSFDDLGVIDGSAFLGKDLNIFDFSPDSDIDAAWTIVGAAGSRWGSIDEQPNDLTTTYISSVTSGQVQRVGFGSYVLSGTEQVEAVAFAGNVGSNGTTGTRTVAVVTQDGSGTDGSPAATWSASINGWRFPSALQVYNTQPAGGAWDQASLDGLRAKLTKSATADEVRVGNLWAYVGVSGAAAAPAERWGVAA